MSLLRRLDDADSWAEHEDSKVFDEGDCPEELFCQAIDPRGISVYSFKTDFELWRCVSALALSRVGLRDVTCAVFSETDICKCGLALKETAGKTFDNKVNKLHRDITGLTLVKVGQFVKMVCKDAEIKVFTKHQIINFINEQLSKQGILRNEVFRDASNIRYGDVLLRLWKDENFSLCHRTSDS